MQRLIELQKMLSPDLLTVIRRRYTMLHTILYSQPIGRRNLALQLDLKEREARTDIDLLTQLGLVTVSAKGVMVTAKGQTVIDDFTPYFAAFNDFQKLEDEIKQTFDLQRVIITPGDSDRDHWVKDELGRRAVAFLQANLTKKQTIAVTGGTSMAAVAEVMQPTEKSTDCTFVPARGGLGERVENQANTICAEMANKMKGDYRLLYVPDPLSEETYRSIIEEPGVKETLHMIKQADLVMHGIGDALTMAERRKASSDVLTKLKSGKAISEAFGYYFDQRGQVVHKVRTVGMQLEDLSNIKTVVAVAGGESKAKAIESYLRQGKSTVLITDEGAAEALIKDF
ncbi:central glycolytic genes regulator [Streptohalobacillus salinus]|uniref:Central glycolytic genes regulator n=1 Tax=Streptohalobacillus salinus TaxID=621096 RepID=A0A2V3WK68_9BACI|nr:sugar-binding domain-containing protein [Streptohalobacillus salinus]PXW93068.1 central glycolytic genes regulator [Streptohalobacillus salinus]